eukprot:GDKK01047019.1.p1 GENE.GDKK01047019.1~~GDKK01047019.1.p1  ORF type:complete len:149 (+),score=63.77 GDKK01047019.1:41-487(+)
MVFFKCGSKTDEKVIAKAPEVSKSNPELKAEMKPEVKAEVKPEDVNVVPNLAEAHEVQEAIDAVAYHESDVAIAQALGDDEVSKEKTLHKAAVDVETDAESVVSDIQTAEAVPEAPVEAVAIAEISDFVIAEGEITIEGEEKSSACFC